MSTYVPIAYQALNGGTRSEFATVLPPGGRVFYVHHSGARSNDPTDIQTRTQDNLNDALGECSSNNGDTVYILPGHAENISAADQMSNLKAGTRIVSLGRGTARGTFTFTTATSTFLLDVDDVSIENCIFNCAGPRGASAALTVAAAFPTTAAGCAFIKNEFQASVDADQFVGDMITLSAAADDFTFQDNYVWGAVDGETVSIITTAGNAARLKVIGNVITTGIVTAATGVLLDLDNAALTDTLILFNILSNTTASSKFVVDPHATSTGFVHGNTFYTGDGGTAPASSAFATYTTTYKFGINQCVTAGGVSALLSPAVDA